jgi:HPt (histidine-containing phosphotransfer) domain-containing protein
MVEEASLGNIMEVANIAHSLKSSARQLGALDLGEACAVTEAAGKADKTELALEGVQAVQREFAAAKPWLKSLAGEA